MPHLSSKKPSHRNSRCLYQIEDYRDRLWNVRFERHTAHGWLLLLGRLVDPGNEEKNCRGGDQVIITRELAAYMEATRMTPGTIDLPVSITTVTRLRRTLGQNFIADRAIWWDEHLYDLTAPQKDVATVYGVSAATIARQSRSRCIIHGSARWTPDEKAQFRQFLTEKLSTREIAARMNKTKGAIKVMRRRLIGNISDVKPWSEEEKAEALHLLASGVKAREVAERLGRTIISLFAMRGRTIGAVSPTKLPWSADERVRLLDMVKSGHSDQEIADALKRSFFTVRNLRQKFIPEANRRKKLKEQY